MRSPYLFFHGALCRRRSLFTATAIGKKDPYACPVPGYAGERAPTPATSVSAHAEFGLGESTIFASADGQGSEGQGSGYAIQPAGGR